MARIRTVKPEFFKHYDLFKAEKETGLPLRLAFQGLWICADKEGRFKWQAETLKLDILPYDDIDFNQCLLELDKYGFIVKYCVGGKDYGCIPTFKDHQRITGTESKSESKIPAPPTQKQQGITKEILGNTLETYRTTGREGKGKEEERKGKERERIQESHSFSGNGNLVPEMKKIWEASFPSYTFDEESDFPAIRKIADFILKISGQKIGFLTSDAEIKTLNTFQLIADQVNREPFWINKPLKSISNNIQEFYNKLKNPIDVPGSKQNGKSSKLDDSVLKQKLAAKHAEWQQNGH